ncbi:MAG: PaaI family thioesterase [Tissierellia bacterium]|nr:PaaI family thioesterase [Tissierellia bacterium]
MIDRERIKKRFESQEFRKFVGINLESIEEGEITVSLDWRKEITQNSGYIHGGMVTALADLACGMTAFSTVDEGQEVVTVELKINFLRPATSKKIYAKSKLLKRGRTVIVIEAEVFNHDDNKMIAKCITTFTPIVAK